RWRIRTAGVRQRETPFHVDHEAELRRQLRLQRRAEQRSGSIGCEVCVAGRCQGCMECWPCDSRWGFTMRILPAFFASGEDFLRDYRAAAPEFDGPAVLIRTKTELPVGADVMLEVHLPGLPNRVRMVGQVAGPGPGYRGVWVVLQAEDRPSLDFVVAHARKFIGTAVARHHERYPVTLPCDWRVTGGQARVLSTTEDLSAGGAFVRAFVPPEIGTELTVE